MNTIPEKLLLFEYSLGRYHTISLYSTSYKTIVIGKYGMMGDCSLEIGYSVPNGSCSIYAHIDLIELMQNKFVELIESKIKSTENHCRLCSDVVFLYELARGVNSVFQGWFLRNQTVIH